MYNTEELFDNAIEKIKKHKLFFIEDIIAFLPCRKSTFYEHFPNDSDSYKRMFEELEVNRIELKVGMRSKWYQSDNATLQVSLMKLICTDDERKKLSLTHSDITTDGDKISNVILNLGNGTSPNNEAIT